MDPIHQFEKEREERVNANSVNQEFIKSANDFMMASVEPKYSYNFSWMGRPIIQYPQDIVVMQELIWKIQPDLIIETGVAHGGSLIFYASMLELIGKGRIIGIDIDIREHNRQAMEQHPMFKRIQLIQGSSIDEEVVGQVKMQVQPGEKVMVILDSNHTHDHVLSELACYSPLVTPESYLVVFDTVIEFLPELFPDRPWGKGNNPYTAVDQFLAQNQQFQRDHSFNNKTLITVAPGGFLRRIS
jgi:cephalosporin hydroxylase